MPSDALLKVDNPITFPFPLITQDLLTQRNEAIASQHSCVASFSELVLYLRNTKAKVEKSDGNGTNR